MKMTASSYVGDRPSELLGEDEPKNTGQLLPVAIALSSFDWLTRVDRPDANDGVGRLCPEGEWFGNNRKFYEQTGWPFGKRKSVL